MEIRDAKNPNPGKLNPLYSLVKYRDFRLLWSASVVMQISEWVQNITLGWLALNLTNSAAFVGRVHFMSGLPLLLLTLPAGVLLDRVDRKRVLITCQVIGAIVAFAVAFLISGSALAPWHLLLTAVLNGSLLAVSIPATQSLAPSLVEREDLTNALGLNSAGGSATRIIGPSLGGVIISAIGSFGCFLFQGAGMLLSAIVSLFIRQNKAPQQAQKAVSKPGNGLTIIRKHPVMMGLMLQAMAPSLLAYPFLVFLPVFVRDKLGLGPSGLGLLMAASGVGALLGSVVVAMLGSYPHKGRILAALGISYGFVVTAFSQSSWVPLSVVLLACSSCVGVSHNALTTALLQAQAPEESRGQVTAALTLSFGFTPIGALVLRQLADYIGVSNAVTSGAIACSICIALTMFYYRKLRQL